MAKWVDLRTKQRGTAPMPAGVWAGSIAADHSLRVGNSRYRSPQA